MPMTSFNYFNFQFSFPLLYYSTSYNLAFPSFRRSQLSIFIFYAHTFSHTFAKLIKFTLTSKNTGSAFTKHIRFLHKLRNPVRHVFSHRKRHVFIVIQWTVTHTSLNHNEIMSNFVRNPGIRDPQNSALTLFFSKSV